MKQMAKKKIRERERESREPSKRREKGIGGRRVYLCFDSVKRSFVSLPFVSFRFAFSWTAVASGDKGKTEKESESVIYRSVTDSNAKCWSKPLNTQKTQK